MTAKLTLQEALREAFEDHAKISKYEAKVIHEIILADGKVSPQERELLQQALKSDQFDEDARELLSQLLLRADQSKGSACCDHSHKSR